MATKTESNIDNEATLAWHARENGRFVDGTYKPVPVALNYPSEHYLHLATEEDSGDAVAYTPSDAYGVADRQVRLKFGRYLRKVFPEMTDQQVQTHVTALKVALAFELEPVKLCFATDRDTINRIFETKMCAWGAGASYCSCMYGKFDGMTVRPYHVYADSPDVAVAYTMQHGEIVARSVVNVKGKEWIRCYSRADGDNDADCGTLRTLLEREGYEKGELLGCRLTKLNTARVMLPYIDNGGQEVREHSSGDWWVVVREEEGEWRADDTDGGATELNVERCECCGDREDDCECSYCECCETRVGDGCDICNFCEHCELCTEHERCNCDRCEDCREVIGERHGCECERCGECNALVNNCDCKRCDECAELTADCDCADDADGVDGVDDAADTVTAPLTVPVVADIDTETITARELLERVWARLKARIDSVHNVEYSALLDAMRILKQMRDLVLADEQQALNARTMRTPYPYTVTPVEEATL